MMAKTVQLLCFLGLFSSVIIFLTSILSHFDQAKLTASPKVFEYEFDIGVVEPSGNSTFEYAIVNPVKADLTLGVPQKSCTCVRFEIGDQALAEGGTLSTLIELRHPRLTGKMSQKLAVPFVSSTSSGAFVINVKGVVRTPWYLPASVELSRGEASFFVPIRNSSPMPITLRVSDAIPVDIVNRNCDFVVPAYGSAQWHMQLTDYPANLRSGELRLLVSGGLGELEDVCETVNLKFPSPALVSWPETICFDGAEVGASRKVNFNSDNRLKVKGFSVPDGLVVSALHEGEDLAASLDIRLVSKVPVNKKNVVTIECADEAGESYRVVLCVSCLSGDL